VHRTTDSVPAKLIGPGTIVGANAVVSRDLPDNVFAGGVPAKVIGPRIDKEPNLFSRFE
jgi:acetyltransferase-like isoleucine patch superfamily enzyme